VKTFKLAAVLAIVTLLSFSCVRSIGNHDYSTLGPGSREVNAVLILDPVEDEPNVANIRQKILFDFDSTKLDAVSLSIVKGVASIMKEHPDTVLALKGHTDKYGSDAYNQTLSENRAIAVQNALIEAGIDPENIASIEGFGKTQLLKNVVNRENRRVLILSIDE